MSTKSLKEFVTDQIEEINYMLATSDDFSSADIRRGMIIVAERLLYSAGIYKGFRYLLSNEVPETQKPGIIIEEGNDFTTREIAFDPLRTDSTRIRFFI